MPPGRVWKLAPFCEVGLNFCHWIHSDIVGKRIYPLALILDPPPYTLPYSPVPKGDG